MALDKRKIWITVGISLVAGTAIGVPVFLAYRDNRNKKIMQLLDTIITTGVGAEGGIGDLGNVFAGKTYYENLDKAKIIYKKLTPENVSKYGKQLSSSLKGDVAHPVNLLANEDEEQVINVFRNLLDKVAIAQVSNWYNVYNKSNILDDLKRLMSGDVAQINDIIASKANYTKV